MNPSRLQLACNSAAILFSHINYPQMNPRIYHALGSKRRLTLQEFFHEFIKFGRFRHFVTPRHTFRHTYKHTVINLIHLLNPLL